LFRALCLQRENPKFENDFFAFNQKPRHKTCPPNLARPKYAKPSKHTFTLIEMVFAEIKLNYFFMEATQISASKFN
jgi:hypothetical protein